MQLQLENTNNNNFEMSCLDQISDLNSSIESRNSHENISSLQVKKKFKKSGNHYETPSKKFAKILSENNF